MYLKFQQILWILIIATLSMAARVYGTLIGLRRLNYAEAHKMIHLSFNPKIPEHCRNQSICEDVSNYPQDYIDDFLRRNSMVFEAVSFMTGGYDTADGCRQAQDPNDVEVCASEVKPLQAKAGRDTNGQWYFLLATPYLCVEKCKNAGELCSHIINVPTGYIATCKQKFINKRFAALNRNGALKHLHPLPIPSACCCHVKQLP